MVYHDHNDGGTYDHDYFGISHENEHDHNCTTGTHSCNENTECKDMFFDNMMKAAWKGNSKYYCTCEKSDDVAPADECWSGTHTCESNSECENMFFRVRKV